ncbi:MAG: M20/M25/M40 family metallo-hydrolase [Planctomycetota bacterium]
MKAPVLLMLVVPLVPAQAAPAAPDRPEPVAARIARAVGAVSPAEIEQTVRILCGFGTRHPLSHTDSDTAGTGAARRWLEASYLALVERSGGRLQVSAQPARVAVTRPGLPATLDLVNVVAVLPGVTDPERMYLVGGHYDSRNGDGGDGRRLAPGANDDASGTAVALEACRVLCDQRFAATLVFCAFDGEEQGLLGSEAYADALGDRHARVDGMITCDIVGNTLGMDGVRRTGHVRCFSYAPSGNDSIGRSLARALTRAAREHVPDFDVQLVFRGDRYGRGGDHRSFFRNGYPAVRLTEPREDYSRQHQDVTERDGAPYGDVPEFVDFAYAANVARVVAATLAELAAAPPPPLVREARGARDAYDTIVEFELPDGVTDCEFVWRETTAPDWQGAIALAAAGVAADGAGTRRTARLRGLCLDDLVVGVRSVGADGARSRVATPPEPDRFQQRPQGGRR